MRSAGAVAEVVAVSMSGHLPGGEDHKLELHYAADSRRPSGLAWSHRRADGRWCTADIPLRGGDRRSGWIVILDEPLTVTPALRCLSCRSVAWLTGGKARPA